MPQNSELERLQRRLAAGRFATAAGILDDGVDAAIPVATATASVEELLSQGFGLLNADAYAEAMPLLRRALTQLLERPETRLLGLACQAAIELGDNEVLAALVAVWVERSRQIDDPAATLASSLLYRGGAHEVIVGELDAAAASLTIASERLQATGSSQRGSHLGLLLVAAWRGNAEIVRVQIDDRIQEASENGQGAALNAAHYVLAVLENGLGNYEAARTAAEQACNYGWFAVSALALPELAEAATRSGASEAASSAAERLAGRAFASRSDWSLGMHHRAQALIDETEAAEQSFRASIRHLARTTVAPQLARTQLLYGEWLRRRRRRQDARDQLESAHTIFVRIGAGAFAERTRNETNSTAQHLNRASRASADLTDRERQVARLVATGVTNPEIGQRLFISPRTVEYHLRAIYRKLNFTTRAQLAAYAARHHLM